MLLWKISEVFTKAITMFLRTSKKLWCAIENIYAYSFIPSKYIATYIDTSTHTYTYIYIYIYTYPYNIIYILYVYVIYIHIIYMTYLKKKSCKILPKQIIIFSKVLGVKVKWLRSSLSILLLLIKRLLTWERCIYYLKFIKDFLMFLADQLYQTVARLQKRFTVFEFFSHLTGTIQESWSYVKDSNDFIN